MAQHASLPLREILRLAFIVCSVALLVAVARRERMMPVGAGPAAADQPMGHAEAIRIQDRLRETEHRLAAAREDLAAAIARLDEKMKAIDAARQQLDDAAQRPVAVAAPDNRDREQMEAQMDGLRKRLDEAVAESAKTKQELERAKQLPEKRPAAAAAPPPKRPPDPNTLGRGAIVDQQTKFDPRRFRDPNMPSARPNPAATAAAGSASAGGGGGGGWNFPGSTAWGDMLRGQGELARGMGQYNLDTSKGIINLQSAKSMAIDNRLKWTETFFEMRRINRTNRAFEAGPRPTIEQVVTFARMQAPRRLTSLELDPVTGTISWPIVLKDSLYLDERKFLDEQFEMRAAAGGSTDFAQFETVGAAIDTFKGKLKDNVAKYPPRKYGEARTFLDSLGREFELPLSQ